MQSFKCVLVGDAKCGKSSFVSALRSVSVNQNYTPTIGVEVIPIYLNTSAGKFQINVWDCAGDPRYACLQDGYYIGGDFSIVMYAETNSNLQRWVKDVYQILPTKPSFICKNKINTLGSDQGVVNISSESVMNINAPFEQFLRAQLNDPNLVVY